MAKKLLNLDTTNGALSFEDSASLPSGTANQTLRHDGTNWVATANSTLTDGNTNVEFKMVNNANPSTKYITSSVLDSQSYHQLHQSAAKYVQTSVTSSNSIIILRNNKASISLTYDAFLSESNMFGIFSGSSPIFSITNIGKIVSNYLSGSGTALIEATADGTIQRSTTAPTKTKIITRLSDGAGIQSFTNTDLGITGDLRNKIIGFEILREWSGYGNYTSQTGLNHKLLNETELTFSFDNPVPITDSLRLAITYID